MFSGNIDLKHYKMLFLYYEIFVDSERNRGFKKAIFTANIIVISNNTTISIYYKQFFKTYYLKLLTRGIIVNVHQTKLYLQQTKLTLYITHIKIINIKKCLSYK